MNEAEFWSNHDITTLYRRHISMVRNRACRLVGDAAAAQEVAQEAFAKFLEHRDRHGDGSDVAAYLYRTATNLSLNRLREGLRQQELSQLRGPRRTQAPMPGDKALREILALVSYDEAQVAAYYYSDGMEQEEIAQLLGIERRTVAARLQCFEDRAQRLLQLTLGFGRRRHVA